MFHSMEPPLSRCGPAPLWPLTEMSRFRPGEMAEVIEHKIPGNIPDVLHFQEQQLRLVVQKYRCGKIVC